MAKFIIIPALTAIAVGYANADYIADLVLPKSDVPAEDFRFTRYPVDKNYFNPDTRVGRLTQPNRVDLNGDEVPASTKDYGLDGPVPQADITKYPNRDLPAEMAAYLTNLLLLDREIRVADFMGNPNNYAPGLVQALSGSSMFSDPTSDPLGVLLAKLDEPLLRPTVASMGHTVWSKLRRHPKLVKAVKNDNGEGAITREQLAELLEIKAVHVGQSRVNAARPGKPASLERVWGNFISLTHVNEQASFATGGVTFGLTATFGDRVAGEIEDANMGLRGGMVIRSGESVEECSIAPHAGTLLQNVV